MEIIPLGDSALVVRVRQGFEHAPEEALDEVLRVFQLLRRADIQGIIEFAPAYTSVGLFYDPIAISKASAKAEVFDWLKARVQACLDTNGDGPPSGRLRREGAPAPAVRIKRKASRVIEIPVCYDREFAPDVDDVARHAQISPQEVVDFHSSADYRVACIGFVPGFPFLAGLPKKLATPRRDVPRKEISPGSVGIGGAQTGIYPLRSPGGWNLIGRTPLTLFDPRNDPPTLLCPGDRVHFRAITREEFECSSIEALKR
jgi:inhibitor of KinA